MPFLQHNKTVVKTLWRSSSSANKSLFVVRVMAVHEEIRLRVKLRSTAVADIVRLKFTCAAKRWRSSRARSANCTNTFTLQRRRGVKTRLSDCVRRRSHLRMSRPCFARQAKGQTANQNTTREDGSTNSHVWDTHQLCQQA